METITSALITFLVIFIIATTSHAKIRLASKGSNLATNSVEEQQYCREACLQKHNYDIISCGKTSICSKCLDSCSLPIEKHNNLHYNLWPLRIATMVKQEFLVLTHLAWEPFDQLTNCLVTWEVYGGGLMGTLLTDSSNVELSLWPETRYRVQVTCKDKDTSQTIKSAPLIVNTSEAIPMKPESIPKDIQIPLKISSHWNDTKSSATYTINTNKDVQKDIKVYHSNYQTSAKLLGMYKNMKEILLGACAAFIVFIFIVTIFCAYRGHQKHYKGYYLREVLVSIDN